jgi:hypothetical protein
MNLEANLRPSLLLVAVLGAGPAGSASADDTAAPAPTSCLTREDIRTTKVIDDRNVLFITRERAMYNNQLSRHCPGMRRSTPLSFTYADHRLCAGSTFSVLMRIGSGSPIAVNDPANNVHYTIPGPSFVQGATCELGLFAPISEDEVKVLMAAGDEQHKSRRRGNRDAVKTEAVEPAAAKQPAGK